MTRLGECRPTSFVRLLEHTSNKSSSLSLSVLYIYVCIKSCNLYLTQMYGERINKPQKIQLKDDSGWNRCGPNLFCIQMAVDVLYQPDLSPHIYCYWGGQYDRELLGMETTTCFPHKSLPLVGPYYVCLKPVVSMLLISVF